MFECIDEDLVIEHGFIISFFLFLYLLLEEFLLHKWIVELSIGIAELVILNEELEPFSQSRLGPMVLGQRRHHLGVLHDEGGVQTLSLQEAAD